MGKRKLQNLNSFCTFTVIWTLLDISFIYHLPRRKIILWSSYLSEESKLKTFVSVFEIWFIYLTTPYVKSPHQLSTGEEYFSYEYKKLLHDRVNLVLGELFYPVGDRVIELPLPTTIQNLAWIIIKSWWIARKKIVSKKHINVNFFSKASSFPKTRTLLLITATTPQSLTPVFTSSNRKGF